MVDIAKNSIGQYSFDRVRSLGIKIYKRILFAIQWQFLNPVFFKHSDYHLLFGDMTGFRPAYSRLNFGQIQADIKAILQEINSFD